MKYQSFTTRTLMAGVAVAALALTACSGGTSDSNGSSVSPEDFTRDVAGTTPGTGALDNVTWNLIWGEPASLDPIYSYADSENTALANMCEGLMRQDEDMTLAPALASDLSYPDDTTLVITLRDDVSFWDGSELTAEDVVYSLKRNTDSELGSYWQSPFYDRVNSIEETGDHEVTITFDEPDSLFERMLSTAAGAIGKKEFIEEAGDSYGTASGGLMCTGPFSFEQWDSGSQITLKKNDAYWDEELQPLVEELELTFVTDESTIANGLLSGDIDGAYMPSLAATEQLLDSGDFLLGLGTDWLAIRPTAKDGPMHELETRQALNLLLDREAIATSVFRGTANPASTPIQPGAWGYAKEQWEAAYDALPDPEFNVEAATEIVQEAGLEGTELLIAYPADSEAEAKTVEILASTSEQAGLSISFEMLPATTFTELYFDDSMRADYDAFIVWEYGAGVADPVVSMSEFTPLSAYNYGDYDDDVLTASVRDALSELDPEKRAELLIEGQQRMVEDLPLIPIVNLENRFFQNDSITGATASRASLYYPWAAQLGATE